MRRVKRTNARLPGVYQFGGRPSGHPGRREARSRVDTNWIPLCGALFEREGKSIVS